RQRAGSAASLPGSASEDRLADLRRSHAIDERQRTGGTPGGSAFPDASVIYIGLYAECDSPTGRGGSPCRAPHQTVLFGGAAEKGARSPDSEIASLCSIFWIDMNPFILRTRLPSDKRAASRRSVSSGCHYAWTCSQKE